MAVERKLIGGEVYALVTFAERPIVEGFMEELRQAGIPALLERPPIELDGMLPTLAPTSLWVPADDLARARMILGLEEE
ncbi:hypothetical protein [Oceanithermus sp.]